MAKKQKKIVDNSFKLKLENSKILKSIVETLASLIDESNFRITSKGFSVKSMDPSKICLLQLEISKDDFDEFECEKDFQIGLNLDDFDKILKRLSSNDTIELSYSEEQQKIKIGMNREGSTHKRVFSLACLDVDVEDVPMDQLLEIEYPSSWSFDPDLLMEAIKDAEIYSDIFTIEVAEKTGLKFTSSGQIGEMEYDLDLEDLEESDLDKTQKGSYSLTFLKSVMKLSNITEKLQIFLKNDHPLKMIFNILEGGELSYFLAPRVDQVEDFEEVEFEEIEEGDFEEVKDTEESKKELEEIEELVEEVE